MGKRKTISYSKFGYIFSIPFVVAFCVFTLYPVLYTILIGFTDLKGVNTKEIHILSDNLFKNYKEVLATKTFKLAGISNIYAWYMNKVITYNIAIDPTEELNPITFDVNEEVWGTETGNAADLGIN